jgi:hypothetical protein
MHILLASIFIGWFVASAIAQFPFASRGARWFLIPWLKRLDRPGLIPAWTFFAPNPGMSDHHLLYRDRLITGSVGVWKELPLHQNRCVIDVIWNPSKRLSKALTDLVMSVVTRPSEFDHAQLKLMVPYLAVLNHVSAASASPLVAARQFMILQTDTDGSDTLLLMSEFHHLSQNDPSGTGL